MEKKEAISQCQSKGGRAPTTVAIGYRGAQNAGAGEAWSGPEIL